MRSYSLVGTWPACTSRSVPRLIAPNSARTVTSPDPGGATCSERSSARPVLTYQRALLCTENLSQDVERDPARRDAREESAPPALLRRQYRTRDRDTARSTARECLDGRSRGNCMENGPSGRSRVGREL